jgi:soluble lytic murein transglycosylase-like protein
MLRAGAASIVWLLLVAVALPARADLYECVQGGKTWLTNHRKPGARCRVVVKDFGSPAEDREKVAAAAEASGQAPRRKKNSWKPPKKVTYDEKAGVGDEKLRNIERIVTLAAQKYNIPEPFIHAVITVESSYKIRALSYKGAMGLMQLMPGTAADMGVTDPYDPYQNVMGATRFLRILANRFNGDMPKVLAAFHAGGSAVARADGIPYQGSDGYVRKVLDNYYRLKKEME